jgi:hypothetical protein
MNQDQLDSAVRTAVKIIGPLLIAHGLQSVATVLNTESVIDAIAEGIGGLAATVLACWSSHRSNASPTIPAIPVATATQTVLTLPAVTSAPKPPLA